MKIRNVQKTAYRPSFSMLVTCLLRTQMQLGTNLFSSAMKFSWVESMKAAKVERGEMRVMSYAEEVTSFIFI